MVKNEKEYQFFLKKIKNPLVKKSLESRSRDFIFTGLLKSLSGHMDSGGRHKDRYKHIDNGKDSNYQERSTHSDFSSRRRKSHMDNKVHTDRVSNHTDSIGSDINYSEYGRYPDECRYCER